MYDLHVKFWTEERTSNTIVPAASVAVGTVPIATVAAQFDTFGRRHGCLVQYDDSRKPTARSSTGQGLYRQFARCHGQKQQHNTNLPMAQSIVICIYLTIQMGYLVYGRHFEGNLKVKCKGKWKNVLCMQRIRLLISAVVVLVDNDATHVIRINSNMEF